MSNLADASFTAVSEACSVLSNPGKSAPYDALGPDRYDDPREVLFYKLNQEVANRELEREYDRERSALKKGDAEGLGFIIFILIIVDSFIPSWVFGPWFYVLNAFSIPARALASTTYSRTDLAITRETRVGNLAESQKCESSCLTTFC